MKRSSSKIPALTQFKPSSALVRRLQTSTTAKADVAPPAETITESERLQQGLNRTRLADVRTKVWVRVVLTIAFLGLLFLQNYWVFNIVKLSLTLENLGQLQIIIGVITAATLGETYLVVKTIVEKMFADNDYRAQTSTSAQELSS